MRTLLAQLRLWRFDALVVAGIALVGYGAGELQPAFGPIVWGLGLLAAVRWGKA